MGVSQKSSIRSIKSWKAILLTSAFLVAIQLLFSFFLQLVGMKIENTNPIVEVMTLTETVIKALLIY